MKSFFKPRLLIIAGIFIALMDIITIFTGCMKVNVDNETNKYDGTYNYQITNINGQSPACTKCAMIDNGNLTIQGTYFSAISVDDFGNIKFTGPCPNGNSAKGTFSGKQGGTNPYQWLGTWTCTDGSIGGPNSIWKLSQ